MVSWNVSRHPEWDLMYLSGLSAREIAVLCRRGVATVHRHLQRREYYEPGFLAKHEAALARRSKNNPPAAWRRRAKEVADFHAKYSRLPRTTGDDAERSLQTWLRVQRKLFEDGDLAMVKILIMNEIPNWHADARQMELDELWRNRLKAVCKHFSEYKQLPRYRTYATDTERSLGVWLHNQHQRRTNGSLSTWRLDALNSALPGWRSRS